MRGEPPREGVCPAREALSPEVRHALVLGLLVLHVALVIASVFVMDWFVTSSVSAQAGWPGHHDSIDLWAVSRCDESAACMSAPLDRGGYEALLPTALATLWVTAAATTLILVRAGSFLAGRLRAPWAPFAGWVLTCALIGCAFVAAVAGGSHVDHGTNVYTTSAPFVLVLAQLIGMAAISYATPDANTRNRLADLMPRARVERG